MTEHMTPNEYQTEALRTEPSWIRSYQCLRLQQGILGLNGEAGECADILKKHLFQGHTLGNKHLALELGDCLWYVAVAADALGYDLEAIMEMNIQKLRARYPDGQFDAGRSLNRAEDDI